MRWRGEDPLDWADLGDPAEIHHKHTVCHMVHHAQVMADEQVGQRELAPSNPSTGSGTCASTDLSSAETGSSRITNRGRSARARAIFTPLPLPAGHFMRVAPPELGRRKAYGLQQVMRASDGGAFD